MHLPSPSTLLVAQLVPTAAMVGVIWVTQLVTYPGFRHIDRASFTDYHARYTRAIGFVVIPLMLCEISLASLSAWQYFSTELQWPTIALAILAGSVWAVTFTLQVPLHLRLASGHCTRDIEQLIRSNWWRTALWTIRLALLGAVVVWA